MEYGEGVMLCEDAENAHFLLQCYDDLIMR